MGDKGKRDKGKKEQQKKAQLTPKEKRKKEERQEERINAQCCPEISASTLSLYLKNHPRASLESARSTELGSLLRAYL